MLYIFICRPGKSVDKEPMSNSKPDAAPPRKQVGSNLNIASPPFYPTGSSTKDNTVPHKRNIQAGTVNRNGQQSLVGESFSMAQSTAMMRGKNIVDSVSRDNLYIDDSPSGVVRKPPNTMPMPLSGSSFVNPAQPQLRGQGRGLNSVTQMAYQPVNKVPSPSHLQNFQKYPIQGRSQSSAQASVQQYTHRSSGGPQVLSPPKAAGSVNSFESGEVESSSESKTALVAKGKGSVQGSGKGPLLYGGAQVMGASGSMGSGHTDQNFPAFLPGKEGTFSCKWF